MLTRITNIHRHKLPRPGAIVRLVGLERNGYSPKQRWQVESFPLTDAADPRYSRGIHTVTLRALSNGRRVRVSGIWCEEME